MTQPEAERKIADAVILERAARVLDRRWPRSSDAVSWAAAARELAGQLRKDAGDA